MRWCLVLGVAGLLSGCAEIRMEQAKATRDQATALCVMIPAQPGTMLRRTNCLIAARDQYVLAVSPGDTDLEEVVDAEAQKMAGDVDAGRMSVPDFRIRMARVMSEATSEARNRNQQAMIARAAVLASMPRPVFQEPAIPRPVTCNSFAIGNNVQTTCQ